MKLTRLLVALCASTALLPGLVLAQKKYDPGATDTEIKIGITVPLSGPASSYGIACPANQGYFAMINDQGGINGRKLKLLCEDDGFVPPKAIEQTRKLVESDQVLFMYNSLGTATNTAVHRYMTARKVPMVLINSGAYKWGDPKANPYTTPSLPSNRSEAKIFAEYVAKNMPNAKVALLFQNDDYGKDYQIGLREQLGPLADKMLVAEQSYELSDPSIDSQIIALRAKNPDVVVLGALAKHATLAIKKIGELGWKPQIFLGWSSSSIPSVLTPAGLEYSKGLLTTAIIKDPRDPKWANDKITNDYKAFMAKYYPTGDPNNISNIYAYATSSVLVDILKRAGNDLTRDNIMKQAQNVDIEPLMYLPGVRFKVSPQDHDPIKQFQMVRFDGAGWQTVG
ncbi:MAG: ABC transporter substrate-binding protein, partial [Pseudomonadota bacterium]